MAAPLEATIMRRDGAYPVRVSGVEIGVEPDIAAATALLCREAAKYSRRVYVTTHVSAKGRQTFEIEEDGTITETAPAAPTAAGAQAASELLRRREASSEQPSTPARQPGAPQQATARQPGSQVHRVATRSGPADPDQQLFVGEGYPGTGSVSRGARGKTSTGWWLRRHKRALVGLLAAALCLVGAAVSAHVNLAAADLARAQQESLESLPEPEPGKLTRLRSRSGPQAGSVAVDRIVAEVRRGGGTVGVERASQPPSYLLPGGTEVRNHGAQVTFTLTGSDPDLRQLLRDAVIPAAPALTVETVRPSETEFVVVAHTHDFTVR